MYAVGEAVKWVKIFNGCLANTNSSKRNNPELPITIAIEPIAVNRWLSRLVSLI